MLSTFFQHQFVELIVLISKFFYIKKTKIQVSFLFIKMLITQNKKCKII